MDCVLHCKILSIFVLFLVKILKKFLNQDNFTRYLVLFSGKK